MNQIDPHADPLTGSGQGTTMHPACGIQALMRGMPHQKTVIATYFLFC